MKDIRGQSKAERQYLARTNVQACSICGRYFTARRADPICSIACLQKQKAKALDMEGETPVGGS
jgi:hypothetical protein